MSRKERLKRNYDLSCQECGKDFKGLRPSDKFCSQSCRWRNVGKRPHVKQRKAESHRTWRENNQSNRREYMLNYTYGISVQQYESLLEEQGGGCAICGKTPEEEGRNLAVDHDHGTGEIYGILCATCNRVLVGKIREPEAFKSAAKYLEKGTGWFVPVRKKKRRKARSPTRPRRTTSTKTTTGSGSS